MTCGGLGDIQPASAVHSNSANQLSHRPHSGEGSGAMGPLGRVR